MCFALPAGNRKQHRTSRMPAALRLLMGGIAWLAILSVSLLIDQLMPGRR